MKKIMFTALLATILFACNNKDEKGKFTLTGDIKNAQTQKIYLDQLYFNQQEPQVIDTGEINNGHFTVTGNSSEDGLYRLRFEKEETGYLFINDKPNIQFNADTKVMSLAGPTFNTAANLAFKNFLLGVDGRQNAMSTLGATLDSLQKNKASDSAIQAAEFIQSKNIADFKKYIISNIDTASSPVVAMFALGYTRGIDPDSLKTVVPNLAKRFSKHTGVASIIEQYNLMLAKKDAPAPAAANNSGITEKLTVGSMAPNFTLADVDGKPFSLSSLRGKYVLIDFWASWCGPCRGENPNVVANYNKYKNKNFTILGVSLDEDKAAWQKAIKNDNLSWQQVSDLKGWGSAIVPIYGFDGIPYNVLIDPNGKIIATLLREEKLGEILGSVLK